MFHGKVVEVANTGAYTYILLDTGEEKIWAVTDSFAVEAGDTVSMPRGNPVGDFFSKSLGRTFDVVYFVPFVTVEGGKGTSPAQSRGSHAGSRPVADLDFSGIKKAEGGKTVAQLFEGMAGLDGQQVKVRGKVVKFVPGVMGKNWIHLSDGSTGPDGLYDLVATSDAVTEVGRTVVVTGTVGINRDFGYGYKYDLLLENARVEVE